MDYPDLYTESVYLSALLNACKFQLPLVNLKQNMATNFCTVFNVLRHQSAVIPFIIVGSTAEGLNTKYKEQLSDVDAIVFISDYKVYEHDFIGKFDDDIGILRLPENEHPGYSKLKVSKTFRCLENCKKYFWDCAYLKNTVKEDILESSEIMIPCSSLHGPAVTHKSVPDEVLTVLSGLFDSDVDIVFCIRCEKWPDEASEWITRKRISNWLTKELYESIINSGYFLAGVGSRESSDHDENELLWRISFNKAEQLIIESFNESQIHCIMFLKWMKCSYLSNTAGKNITSFTMKNLMFWCLEEISTDHWQSSKLLWCICFCITKLKSFVEKGFFPSYFIRNRNLFISSEFSCVIQAKILQRLECFLDDPNSCISLLCSDYKLDRNSSLLGLIQTNQICFVREWFSIRVEMLNNYHYYIRSLFGDIFEEYNVSNTLYRCQYAINIVKSGHYTQQVVKFLENCECVLHYIVQKQINEIKGDTRKKKYSKHLCAGRTGDLTHTNLRIATCLLDDGVNTDCFNIIRTVTENPYLFMQDHIQYHHLNFLHALIAFSKIPPENMYQEIRMYTTIIEETDLIYQDPYKTVEKFEQLNGESTSQWYSPFINSLMQCWYNVTFIQAEISVLPKTAALELCSDNRLKRVSFHPFLYGLLLEFLWHTMNGSIKSKKEAVLRNMKKCVTEIPDEQKSKGLNFITYCCSLQKDYRSASRYLIRSFNLNPVKQNVAYLYIKYILTLLRWTLSDDNDDPSLWLNLLGIEWNID